MPKTSVRSAQQVRDDARNKEAIERVGEDRINYMEMYLKRLLGDYFKFKHLQKLAKETANATDLKVERRANRAFRVLIAWLVENWNIIEDKFVDNAIRFVQIHEANKESTEAQSITKDSSDDSEDVFTFDQFSDSVLRNTNEKTTETQSVTEDESNYSDDAFQIFDQFIENTEECLC